MELDVRGAVSGVVSGWLVGLAVIVAHVVVGPGEASRYLEPVLMRANECCDVIHVSLDPTATDSEQAMAEEWSDVWSWTPHPGFTEHEGQFRSMAWMNMERDVAPSENDLILLLDADELIHDSEAFRRAGRDYHGVRLGFTFYHMWAGDSYRIDGFWKPHIAHIAIPYRKEGRFKDRSLACGREPLYAQNIPTHGIPVSDILHYGYFDDVDKRIKYLRYMELDGGKYHAKSHLESIMQTPSLKGWDKGGLLNVG